MPETENSSEKMTNGTTVIPPRSQATPQTMNVASATAPQSMSANLAWISERLLANLVDAFVFLPVFIILIVVSLATKNVLLIYTYPIFLFIYQFMMISKSGQTIGKKVVKIQVVSDDATTQNVTGKTAFMREIVGRIVESIGPLALVSAIMALVSTKKQSLHDVIAHTVVVKTANNKNSFGSMVLYIALGIIALIVIVLIVPAIFIGLVAAKKMSNPSPVPNIAPATGLYQPGSNPPLPSIQPRSPSGLPLPSTLGGAYENPIFGYVFAYPRPFRLQEVSSSEEILLNADNPAVRIGIVAAKVTPQFGSLAQETDKLIAGMKMNSPNATFSDKTPITLTTNTGQVVQGYSFITRSDNTANARERLIMLFESPDQSYFLSWQLDAPFVTFNNYQPVNNTMLKSLEFRSLLPQANP